MTGGSDRAASAVSMPADIAEGTVAVGWASVELDRAAAELAALLPRGAGFVDAPPSIALGARCRRSTDPVAGVAVVLMEPATEGRLAGFLARWGEGWAATWMSADGRPGQAPASPERPGPFGAERLAAGGAAGGPFRLWLRVATIEP